MSRSTETVICTDDCEIDCPVKSIGRVCPTIAGMRAELRALDGGVLLRSAS